MSVLRIACIALGGLLSGFGLLLLVAFHERYWRWRDCFNALGRCWDPQTEQVYTEAGAMWGVMALLALIPALALLWFGLRRARA